MPLAGKQSPLRGGVIWSRHGRDAGGRHSPLAPPGRAATRAAGSPLRYDPADAARPIMRVFRLLPAAPLRPFTEEELRWLGERVEELGRAVHAVCSERIALLETQAK